MEFTFTFVETFLLAIQLGAPLFAALVFDIVLLGLLVGHFEKWRRREAIYWAFITATTVGYGDFRPAKGISRFFAIVIAVHGLIFFAILGSIAVQATLVAAGEHLDPQALKTLRR